MGYWSKKRNKPVVQRRVVERKKRGDRLQLRWLVRGVASFAGEEITVREKKIAIRKVTKRKKIQSTFTKSKSFSCRQLETISLLLFRRQSSFANKIMVASFTQSKHFRSPLFLGLTRLRISQEISQLIFFSFSSQMCCESAVAFRFFVSLNELL